MEQVIGVVIVVVAILGLVVAVALNTLNDEKRERAAREVRKWEPGTKGMGAGMEEAGAGMEEAEPGTGAGGLKRGSVGGAIIPGKGHLAERGICMEIVALLSGC